MAPPITEAERVICAGIDRAFRNGWRVAGIEPRGGLYGEWAFTIRYGKGGLKKTVIGYEALAQFAAETDRTDKIINKAPANITAS